MSALRERFLQYMRVKGYSGKTLESYEYALEDLARAYKAAPDTLNNAQIQAHVDHLIVERKLAWNTVNVYGASGFVGGFCIEVGRALRARRTVNALEMSRLQKPQIGQLRLPGS